MKSHVQSNYMNHVRPFSDPEKSVWMYQPNLDILRSLASNNHIFYYFQLILGKFLVLSQIYQVLSWFIVFHFSILSYYYFNISLCCTYFNINEIIHIVKLDICLMRLMKECKKILSFLLDDWISSYYCQSCKSWNKRWILTNSSSFCFNVW